MEIVNAPVVNARGKAVSCIEATISLNPSASSLKALSSLCLVGRVVAPMAVNEDDVKEYVTKSWLKKVAVFAMNDALSKPNTFKLGFDCEEDRQWALDQSPWSFKGYSFVLCAWKLGGEGINSVDKFNLWVQIHNLPHEYFSVDNGKLLGGLSGKVLKVELEEDKPCSWHLFLRVLVEINIENSLFSGCFFDLDSGTKRWLQFKYEKVGIFCYFCGRLGHQRKGCTLSSPSTVANSVGVPFPLYGPWLSTASKFHDVFTSTVMKRGSTSSTGSMAVDVVGVGTETVPRIAGAGAISKDFGDRSPSRAVTRIDRDFSGRGKGMQKKWIPKKKGVGSGRGRDEMGNKAMEILNNDGKLSVSFPNILPLTGGFIGENQIGLINAMNMEKPPMIMTDAVTDTLSIGKGSGPSGLVGPTGPKTRCGKNDLFGDKEGCGPVLLINSGPVSSISKQGGPDDVLYNSKAIIDKAFEIGDNSQPEPTLKDVADGEAAHPCMVKEKVLSNVVAQLESGNGSLGAPSCDEGKALSQFFKAQEELLYDLKHFGKLDLYEIKRLGGDIGVPTSSEVNERSTPFKKRKFEGSASLCARPHKTIRTHPDVVRDFPWDNKEKDRESKVIYDDPSEEESDSMSCNKGIMKNPS
ncbi:hypothetical protein F8388_014385 [Cannabis sativa]|uniref:CCHC-type domain-containing protein n=1 Tax=Cannabis sativa TaxID=3483 RepID=A0A7J6FY27_CANSA|nr:hypothetical protein F8388_014385 [Cannabis sativa]